MGVVWRRTFACALALVSCFAAAETRDDPYRFAYRWGNNRVAFELSEYYEALADKLWPAVEKLDEQTPRGELIVFPPPLLEEVKAGVREKIGDVFPMYVPQLAKMVTLKLVTFTPRYCGDGYCGIFGVGETQEMLPELPTPQEREMAGVSACGVVLVGHTPGGPARDWNSDFAHTLAGHELGPLESTSLRLHAGGRTFDVTLSRLPLDELKTVYGDRLEMVEPDDRCGVEIWDPDSREVVGFDDAAPFYRTPRGGIYGAGGLESCGYYSNLRIRVLPDLVGDGRDQYLMITAGASSTILVPRAVNDGGAVVTRIVTLHSNTISP